MKKILVVLAALLVVATACKKDDENEVKDNENNTSCSGEICEPSLLSDEIAATIPEQIQGSFSFTYDYAQEGSPFENGVKADFTLTSNNELIVEIEGEECMTLKNPAFRYGPDSGNYFFKDECNRNISYNVSQNQDGSLNEINVQPYSGMGWFGQFVLD